MDEEQAIDHPAWPERALLLLALGALFGLIFHALTKGDADHAWSTVSWHWGAAAFFATGGIVFAFSLERQRWPWAVGFAVAAGVLVGLITWNNGAGRWTDGEDWQLFSALVAVAVAVPLFQTVRDSGRRRLPYPEVHGHVWTNLVLGAAALVFVGLVFMLGWLLAGLFDLIHLDFLQRLMGKRFFGWMLLGGALGGAVGLLRDRDAVLRTLQRVVTAILSFLAPVLAFGLGGFVLALPFTGLAPLWEQTKATTPVLLAAVLGAFVLLNTVIGNGEEGEEKRPAALRWAAAVLAAVMLPLAAVAGVSTAKRIGQYGLTPDRLWACVFVAIGVAAGLAYLAALIRRRRGWADEARRRNIQLAIGVCAIAFVLAMPFVSFGALATRSQVARLESGRVTAEKFDWAALRYDFGEPGRRAVERLARSARDPKARLLAARVLAQTSRWDTEELARKAEQAVAPHTVRVVPRAAPAPADLVALLYAPGAGKPQERGTCLDTAECLLAWQPGQTVAVASGGSCKEASWLGDRRESCYLTLGLYEQVGGRWQAVKELESGPAIGARRVDDKGIRDALIAGTYEIRPIRARRLFIGHDPASVAFEAP